MKNLVLCAVALVMMTGCRKYSNTLEAAKLQVPAYTETGKNTFGCLVNGAPWANFGETLMRGELGTTSADTNKVVSYIEIFYPSTDTTLVISGILSVLKNSKALRQEYMAVEIPKNGSLKGVHQLTSRDGLFHYIVIDKQYGSLIRNPFTVTVNKDSIVNGFRHIVSGRFNGTLYNYTQTDSVRITDGVFDIITR